MNQIAAPVTAVSNRSLTQWLFNPFRFIAGFKALLLGLIVIALTSLLASLSDTHFDGTLDVHLGLQAANMGMKLPFWLFLAE
jgi:hypothetical protein